MARGTVPEAGEASTDVAAALSLVLCSLVNGAASPFKRPLLNHLGCVDSLKKSQLKENVPLWGKKKKTGKEMIS